MSTEFRFKGADAKEPFHYTMCGLDDVYLTSGYERVATEYGDGIAIQDMDGLHKAVGEFLVRFKKTLNGKEVRFLRHDLDLTQSDLADILRVTDQTVARWEKGEVQVPGPAELLLRLVYLEHIDGRMDVKDLAEAIRQVDQPAVEKNVFAETHEGWRRIAA